MKSVKIESDNGQNRKVRRNRLSRVKVTRNDKAEQNTKARASRASGSTDVPRGLGEEEKWGK